MPVSVKREENPVSIKKEEDSILASVSENEESSVGGNGDNNRSEDNDILT